MGTQLYPSTALVVNGDTLALACPNMEHGDPVEPGPKDSARWSAGVMRRIAQSVKARREERGWRQLDLANRCTAPGSDVVIIPRGAIAKIEIGQRDISIPELIVLAEALEVPPILLLFPTDQAEIEWMPGQNLPALVAVNRFAGEATDGAGRVLPGISSQYVAAVQSLWRLRRHARAEGAVLEALNDGPGERLDAARRDLLELRLAMQAAGDALPPLAPDALPPAPPTDRRGGPDAS